MAINKWYENSYRRNLVDMHIDDWNEEFFSEFDPKQYFDCLNRGKIKSPMIYLQSHVGLCNWPSQSAPMHKGFKGKNKLLELINLCHDGGMDVIGYYSLIFNNWAYNENPSWRMLDINGRSSRENDAIGIVCGGRYGILCPNNDQYREFINTQLNELLDIYPLEGMFLDMAFWPMVCNCSACAERYLQETGKNIPKIIDWNDSEWCEFQRKREEWMGEFAKYCTKTIKTIKPDLSVEHNFANICQNWMFGVTEGVSDASDYTGGDLYGGHYHEDFICKLYYEITQNQPFEYMTSRCDPGLADHTTTKSVESLKLHNFLTLAHHGAMLFIDAIDPKGTMNPHAYDLIGQVFSSSMPFEKYLTGQMISDIAIYFSLESRQEHRPVSLTNEYSYPQIEACIGAATTLSNANYLYSVIPSNRIEKIMDKKVIIISEAKFMSDKKIKAFLDYVKKGGCLYISGNTDHRLAKELLGIDMQGFTDESITFISPTPEGQSFFGEMYSSDYPVCYNSKQILAQNNNGAEVLATITLPYTNPKDLKRFSSIHSNPPGIKTERPSIIRGDYGKGHVIWSAASFESNSQQAHKKIFEKLIRQLYKNDPILQSNAPKYVRFTVFDDIDKKTLLINIVSVQENEPFIKTKPFDINLAMDRPIRSIHILPEKTEIRFSNQHGKVNFTIDNLDLFCMYMLQYD